MPIGTKTLSSCHLSSTCGVTIAIFLKFTKYFILVKDTATGRYKFTLMYTLF